MLDAKADRLCGAARSAGSEQRQDTRAGRYERTLEIRAAEVTLKVLKLRRRTSEPAIIEHYRQRACSVEEAFIEMLSGRSTVRRVEDITETLWGTRVSPSKMSSLKLKIYAKGEAWRHSQVESNRPYVYVDGIVMKRRWAGEVRNVSLLVASTVNSEGFREILGICEDAKEDNSGWSASLRRLVHRSLEGVQLMVSDAWRILMEIASDYLPEARWQRCMVHFYRTVFNHVPSAKVRNIKYMPKEIRAQKSRQAAEEKAGTVVGELRAERMGAAADFIERCAHEPLTDYTFADIYWLKIRTNNPLEHTMKEIRRQTRVGKAFPDGQSCRNLAPPRVGHIAGSTWSTDCYTKMTPLYQSNILKTVALA